MCIWGNPKSTISVPFLSKYVIYTILGVARGQRPLAIENFVFGGLNLYNFRPFVVLTFYKDIEFLGGLKDTPAPTQNIEGSQPSRAPWFLSL